VGDELVARVPELVRVAVAGEVEGALDGGPVDRQAGRDRGSARSSGGRRIAVLARVGVELLDDREEIGE